MYAMMEKPLTRSELETMLESVGRARIGLIGDMCLDMYWLADMTLSEISRETPHFPLPIVEERYQPGGAGNAACNIAALKPGVVKVIGIAGADWRGDLLVKALSDRGIDCSHIVRDASVTTNAYIKPLRKGISDVIYEDPRLDFENRAPLNAQAEQKVLEQLDAAVGESLQIIAVCGNNTKAKADLEAMETRCRLLPLGFVDYVDHLMDAADCIVTKPGGLTTSEALAKGLPMVIVNPIPGQEARNAQFLLNSGTAVATHDMCTADELVIRLMDEPRRLEAMRLSIEELRHPTSTADVCEFVMRLCAERT